MKLMKFELHFSIFKWKYTLCLCFRAPHLHVSFPTPWQAP